ncbi:MAG: MBL fold metallo-hydrolase [Planctomycetes bacterium RBG_13_46_10]|nr:MAG: MBL fold metallo-hydrolase [Planctomycetes bacterium RBG_13_46_10]
MSTEFTLTPGANNLTITVIYDNNRNSEELEIAWGFSALITGNKKTILFDTGGDGSLLLSNMKKLAIEPNDIDAVVLSHIHADHTGGLADFLQKNLNVTVFMPESFPKKLKENIQQYGAKTVEVKESLMICENVYSTGQLGRLIKEQSLIIRTKAGLIIITGCAHPGIVKMLTAAKDLMKSLDPARDGNDVLLVMGGFHLEWATKGKIEKIISSFKQTGVRYIAPCHCAGEKARSLFEKHFGKNYINIGAGKEIAAANLQ